MHNGMVVVCIKDVCKARQAEDVEAGQEFQMLHNRDVLASFRYSLCTLCVYKSVSEFISLLLLLLLSAFSGHNETNLHSISPYLSFEALILTVSALSGLVSGSNLYVKI